MEVLVSGDSDFWQSSYAGQSFFYSELSPSGTSFGMNVAGSGGSSGTSIIVWPWGGGAQNELWSLDDDGHLIPGNCQGQMVAGLGEPLDGETGNYVVLVPMDSSGRDITQLWYPTASGFLQNKSNQSIIGVAPDDITTGPALVCVPEGSSYASGFTWTQIPAVDVGEQQQWYFIQTALPESDVNFGLNIQGAVSSYLTPVILYPWQGGKPNEIWRLQNDGTIVSKLTNTVLGNQLPLILTHVGPEFGNLVISGPDSITKYNTWTVGDIPGGSLQSLSTAQGQLLAVDGTVATSGATVIVSDQPTDGPAPNQIWQVVPTNIFTTLLQMPPQAYPPMTGDWIAGYQYINDYLGLQGNTLRGEYPNLNAPLAGWSAQLSDMPAPPTSVMTEDDFHALRDQLQSEITKVQAAINYFSNYEDFYNNLFTIDSTSLNQVIEMAGLCSSDQISGGWWAAIEGVVYTLLNIAGTDWNPAFVAGKAIVANLVNTGLSIAAATAGPDLDNNFQVAAGQLWEKLAASFSEFNNSVQNLTWVFIADWGKLQAAYPLMLGNGGINSLSWPPNKNMTPLGVPGYDQAVMQMLLPARYLIWAEWVGDAPTNDPVGNVYGVGTLNPAPGWFLCSLRGLDSYYTVPAPALLDYLFGSDSALSGVINPEDFFTGKNGWNFTIHAV
jgi:hypothetical protein